MQQQNLLAQARGQIATGLIQVYRALGGGWQLRLDPAANGPPPPIAPPDVEPSAPPNKVPEQLPAPIVAPPGQPAPANVPQALPAPGAATRVQPFVPQAQPSAAQRGPRIPKCNPPG